jgi:hypothetical protein
MTRSSSKSSSRSSSNYTVHSKINRMAKKFGGEIKKLKQENKKLNEKIDAIKLDQNMKIDEIYNVLKKVASKNNVDMSHIDYRLWQTMD